MTQSEWLGRQAEDDDISACDPDPGNVTLP
jgi:hypothetical protein